MDIAVVGTNFRTAPIEQREKFALSGDLASRLLRTIRSEHIFAEAILLDTCNRTECYLVPSGDQDPRAAMTALIARMKGMELTAEPSEFYHHSGPEAVKHLFRVSAAMDSQIVGEHQILGQVKKAYRLATAEKTSRFLLNKLMHGAFKTAKRVQAETDLGRGSISVAKTAVDMAGQIFTHLSGKTALIVGAGTTAQTVARTLVASGVHNIIVANRTLARAEQLAETLTAAPVTDKDDLGRCEESYADPEPVTQPPSVAPNIRSIELHRIPEVIGEVDLAICSTGSDEPVLTRDMLADRLRRRREPLFIVDIAVPRDVEPELGRLSNVFLYNMDDLDRVVSDNIERRRLEIPRAEAIVDYEVQQFCKWHNSLQVTETITQLRQHFERLQEVQIGRYGKQFDRDNRQQLDIFTKDMCKKMLHRPTAYLRKLAQEADASDRLMAVDTLRRMFDLDQLENDS